MHKSKNYDMATQVAMDKLMPKPIQITISMQGGGGLTGLGDRPFSSVYGRPIPRTIYRYNGGGFGDPSLGDPWASDEPDITPTPLSMTSDTFNMSDWDTYGGWRQSADILGGGKSSEELAEIYGDLGSDSTDTDDTETTNIQGLLRVLSKELDPFRKLLGHPRMSKDGYFYTNRPRQKYAGVLPQARPGGSLLLGDRSPGAMSGGHPYTQPLPPAQAAPLDPRSTEVIVAQKFVDYVRENAPVGKGLNFPIDVEKDLARHAGGVQNFIDRIKEGEYGQFSKGLPIPKELESLAKSNPPRRRKGGGGLSSVNKPININGQPHKLAWIRPDEASALRAMGGSGRKVGGVPAYFFFDQGGSTEVTEDISYTGGDPELGYPSTPSTPTHQGDPHITYVPSTTDQRVDQDQRGEDPIQPLEKARRYPAKGFVDKEYTGVTGKELGDVAPTQSTKDTAAAVSDLGKGLFGGQYDWDDVRSLWMTQYITQHPGGKRDPYSQKEIDIEDEWQRALKSSGGLSALAKGFAVGDPFGASLGNESKNAIDKLKRIRDKKRAEFAEKEGDITDEQSRDVAIEAAKEAFGESFTESKGIDWPMWAPGGMLSAGLNFLSSGIIGTATIGGIGMHVHEDGSLTPISPEDTPGYDWTGREGEPVERKRKRRPVREVDTTKTVVEDTAPAKGTMKELLSRRSPAATREEGLASLKENILSSIYPDRDFNI